MLEVGGHLKVKNSLLIVRYTAATWLTEHWQVI